MIKTLMKKHSDRLKKGFTLAELLVAVAIIGILAGVSFISVASYLRSMAQLERDAIAKEIYVAAQNHLTMAEGQGFLGVNKSKYGIATSKPNTYYYIVNNGSGDFKDSMLGLMLPFGSVDETVRLGGNYLIHYQTNPALVLDVYYSVSGGDQRYQHTFSESPENETFLENTDTKEERRNYKGDSPPSVIGYYGAEDAKSLVTNVLKTPTIKVINAEKLYVEITDPNKEDFASLKLIVKGEISEKEKAIIVRVENGSTEAKNTFFSIKEDTTNTEYNKYWVVLDDITKQVLDDITKQRQHFCELFDGFFPGEDISIQAESYSSTSLANIENSVIYTTNSLFEDIEISKTSSMNDVLDTALIGNIRHLENLDKTLSKVSDSETKIAITKAKQTTDLSWTDFVEDIKKNPAATNTPTVVNVYTERSTDHVTEDNCFYPVTPGQYSLLYDGDEYRISDVQVNISGNAGLFGTLPNGSQVKNLELVDFSIAVKKPDSSGNTKVYSAGALAGDAENATVSNVVVYNSSDNTATSNISTYAGSAGGLIGSMKGGSVTASASAVYVKNESGDAGGLIGTIAAIEGGTEPSIESCYSSGHTEEGSYYKSASGTNEKTPIYSVEGTGKVGGLVGDAGPAKISYSYSTCSVSAGTGTSGTAGGLIGTGTDTGTSTKCYCTGLVNGATKGAFAGTYTGTASGCQFFKIINEVSDDSGFTGYLGAVKDKEYNNIAAFDSDLSSYQNFTSGTWVDALPYDSSLEKYYDYKYNLKSVEQLKGSSLGNEYDYYVKMHYGDWPSPEVQVENTAETAASTP